MADTNTRNPSSSMLPVPVEEDENSRMQSTIHQAFEEKIVPHEQLGNLDICRKIFNLIINTLPPLPVWLSYADFELRHGQVDHAREIFEALVKHQPCPSSWVRYAEFEYTYGSEIGLRFIKDRAISNLKEKEEGIVGLLLAFAEFEEKCKDLENATRIYKSVLDNCKCSKALCKKILGFERRHGEKNRFVKRVLIDLKDYFELSVKINPWDYDAWWGYIYMLEETGSPKDSIRLLYNRALKNVPKIDEKTYWKQYVYFWILYAFFEEIDAEDIDRARRAYIKCIRLIPHDKFSFSKIWLFAAIFEIKQLQVENMRKILDSAIRFVPKVKLLRKYLEIEIQLGNVQQIRKLYTTLVQWSPDDSHEEWIQTAEFENSIHETVRGRFVFERAVTQPALQNSKHLWKAYTDFEISVGEIELTRELHNKVWSKNASYLNVCVSLARFEAYGVQEILKKRGDDDDKSIESSCIEEARKVFNKGLNNSESDKDRIVIAKEWIEVEKSFGEIGNHGMVYDKLPWAIRMRLIQDGVDHVALEEEDGESRSELRFWPYFGGDVEALQQPNKFYFLSPQDQQADVIEPGPPNKLYFLSPQIQQVDMIEPAQKQEEQLVSKAGDPEQDDSGADEPQKYKLVFFY